MRTLYGTTIYFILIINNKILYGYVRRSAHTFLLY
jgi:hypothetical protein